MSELQMGHIPSLTSARQSRHHQEGVVKEYDDQYCLSHRLLSEARRDLYECVLRETHIQEIYRLARLHFPRLHREDYPGDITTDDVAELEKWIGRAKSNDGLRRISDALAELQRFKPSDIRRNLYALVQKIIIEGPHGG